MPVPTYQRRLHWRVNIMLYNGKAHAALWFMLSIAACSAAPAASDETTVKTARQDARRTDFWFNRDAVQGAVLMGRSPTGASQIVFNGAPIAATADGYFIIGIDRDAPAVSVLSWQHNGTAQKRSIAVRSGIWRIERVNTPYRGSATSDADYQKRRAAELSQIKAARSLISDSQGWRQQFMWPIDYQVKGGRISGLFGSQRIYQGKPGSYHSGIDIAMPTGTPFVAPADGVVVLAAKTPFTLEGYLLMIDHGMGLNSAFLHCSALLVSAGDRVKQGQVIGKVGTTGRSSGPHLHWGMRWQEARVDPHLMVP